MNIKLNPRAFAHHLEFLDSIARCGCSSIINFKGNRNGLRFYAVRDDVCGMVWLPVRSETHLQSAGAITLRHFDKYVSGFHDAIELACDEKSVALGDGGRWY